MDHSAWRQPGYGRCFGGRNPAMAVGKVPQRGLRVRYRRRTSARENPGRQGAARLVHISPARTLLPGPHRSLSMMIRTQISLDKQEYDIARIEAAALGAIALQPID